MFIKLTQFTNWMNEKTRPVYINPHQITYMAEFTGKYYRTVEEETATRREQYEQRTTSISFAAGLNEESDSIMVLESAEDIMQEIEKLI